MRSNERPRQDAMGRCPSGAWNAQRRDVRAKRIRPSCLQETYMDTLMLRVQDAQEQCAGKEREHDPMDGGGRTMSGTVVEERKLTFMRPNEVTKYSWGAPERSDKVLLGCPNECA